jgi:hypothetical protein
MNEKEQGLFTADIDHSQVFGEDCHGLTTTYFDNKDISQEYLTRFIFNECLKQAAVAKQSVKRAMRHPFVIIRFAIALWLKLGINKYEFMWQCLYLPSVRTLSDYASPGINAPDGVMFIVLAHEEKMYDNYYAGKKIEIPAEDSYSRMGTLGYDSIACRQGLHFNMATHELVGVGKDALYLDIIVQEFKKDAYSGQEGEGPPNSEVELRANHCLLIFISTVGWKISACQVLLCKICHVPHGRSFYSQCCP